MKIISAIFIALFGAAYLSAQESAHQLNTSQDQQLLLNGDQSASNWRGYGWRGWRGWGGYGGYAPGYEAPVEKLPPVYEEVRVPVVKQRFVDQEIIKVVRPEIRTVTVPRTFRRTVVGSPVEAPVAGGPAPVAGGPAVQGPPAQGDGQQGPPPDAQQGGPQQSPPHDAQQGGGQQGPPNAQQGGAQPNFGPQGQGGGSQPNLAPQGQQGTAPQGN